MTDLHFDPIIKAGHIHLGDFVTAPSPYRPGWTHCGKVTCIMDGRDAIIRCDRADFVVIPLRSVTCVTRYAV